ncbi:hypothetical protein JCM8202v2_006095 [Rhodotorula sphaerocarpa]
MARSPARPESAAPELAILTNPAALHALKRAQLLALCKQHGVKGSGKNVDLISRLEERGRFLNDQADNESDDPEEGPDKTADLSTASWTVVSPNVRTQKTMTADFGPAADVLGRGSVSSSASLASTLRSAGSTLYRALVPSTSQRSLAEMPAVETTAPPPIYSSLDAFQPRQTDKIRPTATMCNDPSGIRPVSRASSVSRADSGATIAPTNSESPTRASATDALPFVFGTPGPETGGRAFTFTMPGALAASTASTESASSEHRDQLQPPPVESLMEEVNRRAKEARAAAEASGITRNQSLLFGPVSGSATGLAGRGKAESTFEEVHKETFAKMDSITNHYAAKRKIGSSSEFARLTRSGSGSDFSRSDAAPAAKRRKGDSPPTAAKKAQRDERIVAALRQEGWSSVEDSQTSNSLGASLRDRSRPLSKSGARLAAQPDTDQASRERQVERAKVRRKSGVTNGSGLSKRRPSLGIGPQSSKYSAGRRYRATIRKLTTSAAVPPLPTRKASAPTVEAAAPARPLPRFAAPTASTSARAALTAAASPLPATRPISPLKRSALKRAGLGDSACKLAGGQSQSQAVPRPASTLFSPTPASSAGGVVRREDAAQAQLLALPAAPAHPFYPVPAALAAGAPVGWQAPAITRKPLLPTTPQADFKSAPSLPPPSTKKKTASGSTKALRAGEKGQAKKQVDGIEARARLVRAKASAAKAVQARKPAS